MNKENVVQLQQVKEERFSQKKHRLTEKLRSFIDSKLSFNQEQTLLNQFKRRTDREISERAEQMFFDFWLYFFHRYENGLRGIEWFANEQASKLSEDELELIKVWASLQPRLVEAIDKTDSSIVFKDMLTQEILPVPFPSEQLHSFFPWYGTFALVEPVGEQYFFHGVNVMSSPEKIEQAKRKIEELQEKNQDQRTVLYDYYLEILTASIKNPDTVLREMREMSIYKIHADLLDEKKVAGYFYELGELTIDEWNETKMQAGWIKNWKVYKDSEIDEDVVMADVFGDVMIADQTLTFSCYSKETKEAFLAKLKEVDMYVGNVTEEQEMLTIPMKAELHNTMIKMGENVPPYVALYAQTVGMIDVERDIPKYDHLSLRELVKQNRVEEADRWLKQTEYHTYLMAEEEYGEVTFTADFNSIRKTLGLPLSPFVTGGASRKSSIDETNPQNEKPKLVTEEEAELYESLGFAPETFNTFYTEDILSFYNEKASGRAKNTVKKYRDSLYDIREALEHSGYENWAEVDDEFWEKVIVNDFYNINGPASKSHIKEFLSTVKMFTKWIDKKNKTKVAKDVAAFISTVEQELLDGAELVAHFIPFYRSHGAVNEKMSELARILRNIDGQYEEIIEGKFQVTKKNKSSLRLTALYDDNVSSFTAKLAPELIQFVHEA